MLLLAVALAFVACIAAFPADFAITPGSLFNATLRSQLTKPPAWSLKEVHTCSPDFSRGKLNPWDCLQAFTKLPGTTYVKFD